MEVGLALAGAFIVLVALLDALWTTLWIDAGAAPISRGVMRSVHWVFARIGGSKRSRLRSLGSPAILVASLGAWVLLLWIGWFLLFLSTPSAVVDSSTHVAAGVVDRAYFVGYTIFTLGNGDFAPQGALWQLLTVVASGTGLVLVTLGITYLLSVLSAHVDQRATASFILDTASDPVDLVIRLRGDGTWSDAHAMARWIGGRLGRTTDQHLAYPVLHFLWSADRSKSPAIAVAVLDEALTLIRTAVRPDARPTSLSLDALYATLEEYAKTMPRGPSSGMPEPPPAPDFARLAASGVPVVDANEFEEALAGVRERRQRLLDLVRASGWSWPSRGRAEPAE